MKSLVIIIGAPRSGTNMLRDMLTKLDSVKTWPCDEINYIWRHGNVFYSHDQFSPEMATNKVKKYLNQEFRRFSEISNADIVIEKTCANSLRVDFVNEVFPNAKFIYIERDGGDVIGSAKLRWTSKLDVKYILKKVRFVPKTDLPFYALRYLSHRVYKLFSKEKRLGSWGPVLHDMDQVVRDNSLMGTCAIQWSRCVTEARSAFDKIDDRRVFRVKYEDFVNNTEEEFRRLAKFIGKEVSERQLEVVCSQVSTGSVGKGRSQIDKSEHRLINEKVGSVLRICGYPLIGDEK